MKIVLLILRCLCIAGIALLIPYDITQWQYWVIMVLVIIHGTLWNMEDN